VLCGYHITTTKFKIGMPTITYVMAHFLFLFVRPVDLKLTSLSISKCCTCDVQFMYQNISFNITLFVSCKGIARCHKWGRNKLILWLLRFFCIRMFIHSWVLCAPYAY